MDLLRIRSETVTQSYYIYNSQFKDSLRIVKDQVAFCEFQSKPSPGCGAIGYCRAAAGFDRVSEIYPQDIMNNFQISIMISKYIYYTSKCLKSY